MGNVQIADVLQNRMCARAPSQFPAVLKTLRQLFVDCGRPEFLGQEDLLFGWRAVESLFLGACASVPPQLNFKFTFAAVADLRVSLCPSPTCVSHPFDCFVGHVPPQPCATVQTVLRPVQARRGTLPATVAPALAATSPPRSFGTSKCTFSSAGAAQPGMTR